MKSLLSACALLLAAPVAAQTAPAADHHAGHAQQQNGQPMDHSKHQGADHAKHMACCKDGKHAECCDKAKSMDCDKSASEAGHSKH